MNISAFSAVTRIPLPLDAKERAPRTVLNAKIPSDEVEFVRKIGNGNATLGVRVIIQHMMREHALGRV